MIYWIQASKDVKLSNIGCTLMEPLQLIKTEDRLSRNLSDEDLNCTINHNIIRLADDKIDDTMVIAIDPGDMMKPYANDRFRLSLFPDLSVNKKKRKTE